MPDPLAVRIVQAAESAIDRHHKAHLGEGRDAAVACCGSLLMKVCMTGSTAIRFASWPTTSNGAGMSDRDDPPYIAGGGNAGGPSTARYDETGAFIGHEPRECGEHRTTGRRVWCFNCTEWCYPEGPCTRCETPHLVRVSADPDTVERVAQAVHKPACGCDGSLHSPEEWDVAFCGWAHAAIHAIGGGDG